MKIFSRTEPEIKEWSVEHPELGTIHYTRKRKLKRIQVRVTPFQGVRVSFPPQSTEKAVQDFLDNHLDWIWKSVARARLLEKNARFFFSSITPASEKSIRDALSKRIGELAGQHGFTYGKLSFRNQKSRWGSCSGANNISLNKILYYLPEELKDYVLLHELAHTREKNHSNHFWEILYDILGQAETKQRRKNLRDFEFLFYPPVEDVGII